MLMMHYIKRQVVFLHTIRPDPMSGKGKLGGSAKSKKWRPDIKHRHFGKEHKCLEDIAKFKCLTF